MTTDRRLDETISRWLEGEAPTQLPDRVLRATFERTRGSKQQGGWRAVLRRIQMNRMIFGLATAAVVVVAVVLGVGLYFNNPGVGAPPSPSPTIAPTAASTASPKPTSEPTRSPAAAPPLTQSFTSTLHGFSVSYPEGWTARAATEPWTDSTFPVNFEMSHADFLYDPTLTSNLFLTIASQPIGDATPEDWVAEQMASDEGCTATAPIAVDGATGLIGAGDCDVAVVTTAGRGYWIQLYTSDDDPAAVAAYDRAWFEEVLATVQLQPEDGVD